MRVLALVALFTIAFGQRWQIEHSRLATILFGISYADEFNGFVPGAQDGSGPLILKTTNGGASYQWTPNSGSTLMFMAGAAHSPTSAAASGVGILASGIQYTTNGNNFVDAPIDALVGASQSGAAVKGRVGIREGAFGFVGSFVPLDNAIAFTSNGGANWGVHEVANAPSSVRYGAYPTLTTWYITGGHWPRKAAATEGVNQLSEKVTVNMHNETKRTTVTFSEASTEKSGYIGFISKTVDGGRSFQTVFYNDADGFYFNGIDCADADHCLAVAEGAQGAYLFQTVNGGATWNQVLFLPGRAASLFDVKYVNNREAWACGGNVDFSFTGQFFHTLDGGFNWTPNPLPGVYGTTLSFVPVRGAYHGHATALTLDGQSSTLVYK